MRRRTRQLKAARQAHQVEGQHSAVRFGCPRQLPAQQRSSRGVPVQGKALAAPQAPACLHAQHALQPALDLLPAELRVAVVVEQALLGSQQGAVGREHW